MPKREQNPLGENADLAEDEIMVVLAFRNCSDRRKQAIKTFALKLANLQPSLADSTNVIPFARYKKF